MRLALRLQGQVNQMWRGFLVISEIAVLIFVLRLPMVQYIFKDAQAEVSSWYEYVATWQERKELESLLSVTAPMREQLRPFQQDYVDEILQSRDSIISFHHTYCVTDDINPFISGGELRHFCAAIASTELLSATL